MRDLEQNPYTLEERALRRALIEDHGLTDEEHDNEFDVVLDSNMVVDRDTLAAVAELEAAHPTNLLAQTAVLPKDARAEIAPPDIPALITKFPQEENQ